MDDTDKMASTGGTAKAKNCGDDDDVNRHQHGSADGGRAKAQGIANTEAVEFLKQLRPPPSILIAIVPDGPITAITAHSSKDVEVFVSTHNNKDNLYYNVNPTKTALNKKPKKTDIAAVEFLLGDLDPLNDEKSEDAKARYLNQLNGSFEPKPSVIVDSGNGIQCLWKLANPIVLGDAKDSVVADVEARSAELMRRLGAKAGTQNIDRILRLPGTTNLPTKTKLKAGRVPCPTKLLAFNGASYPLELFVPGTPDDGGHHARQEYADKERRAAVEVDALPVSEPIRNLIRGIDDREHQYPSRSERVMAILTAMVSAGCTDEQMAAVILDKNLPIGEHVREQSRVVNYLKRQIEHARAVASPGQRVEVKIKADLDDVLKSAADLQHKQFEELRFIVPKHLPEGCALLGGRPKVGKSWLALDAGIAVSSGGACMGQQCEQGDVLGLFLEDTDRRLQRRMTMMLGAYKDSWPASLTYATGWPPLNGRRLEWVRRWIDKARKPLLIIIDILERIRQRTKKDDRQSQYSADYEALVSLQELSAEAQLSILILVHQRKLGAEDLIDTVSGTLGLGGAVDTVLILGKDQQFGKFLYGRGRDLE